MKDINVVIISPVQWHYIAVNIDMDYPVSPLIFNYIHTMRKEAFFFLLPGRQVPISDTNTWPAEQVPPKRSNAGMQIDPAFNAPSRHLQTPSLEPIKLIESGTLKQNFYQ